MEYKNKFLRETNQINTKENFNILFQNEDSFNENEIDNFNEKLKEFIEIQKDNDEIDLSFICFHNEVKTDIFISNNTFFKTFHFQNTIFYKKVYFTDSIFNNEVFFEGAIFKDWVNFNRCEFKKDCSFESVSFEEKIEFKEAKFISDAKFSTAIFNKFTSFERAKFYKEVDFENTIAKDLFYFYKVSIGKLNFIGANLEKANFLILKDNANNVLSKKNFNNKDTARLIKAHFESENNPNDSNPYFIIEQEFYLELLNNPDTTFPNRRVNKISVLIHKYVSSYGTDWVRVLIVLFGFGFLASFIYTFFDISFSKDVFFNIDEIWLLWIGFSFIYLLYIVYNDKEWILFSLMIIIYLIFYSSIDILQDIQNKVSTLLNPLNIFKQNKEYFKDIVLYGIFVKAVVSTLIYQFVISFRNSTKRK